MGFMKLPTLPGITVEYTLKANTRRPSFKGIDLKTHQDVHIKSIGLYPSKARTRIMNEVKAAARLTHPNLAAIYRVVTSGNELYCISEYVAGESLQAELQHEHPETSQEVLDLGKRVAEALRALHGAGVLHRNLHPGNIVVTKKGDLKVIDFGLPPDTQAPYAAPEILAGRSGDPRSDLFSLGVVMRRIARSSLGPGAASGGSDAGPKGPPGLSLAAVIERLTAHLPEDRFQSADELLNDLTRIEETRGAPAPSIEYSRIELPGAPAPPPTGGGSWWSPGESTELSSEGDETSAPMADPVPSEIEPVQVKDVEPAYADEDMTTESMTAEPPRERPEPPEQSEEAVAPPSAPQRHVNVWFEGDAEPVVPLRVGGLYSLIINIGPRRLDSSDARLFAEPDFGARDHLALLVGLYSDDFEIAERQLGLTLPRRGSSEAVRTSVVPRHGGTCRIEIVISLEKELHVLQSLGFSVEALEVEAGAALQMEG